jgi:hypothetical protein
MRQGRCRADERGDGFVGLALLAALCGCHDAHEHARPLRVQRASIIGGEPAPEQHAAVMVTHRDRALLCSGALIAERLVVTAKHCAFEERAGGDWAPLPTDGFRVRFGASDERYEERHAEMLSWIGEPDELSVEVAAAAGEDVALLRLNEPAPLESEPLAVALAYMPRFRDRLATFGFGISSAETGSSGVRLRGTGELTGFDPMTGIVQLEGPSACMGDSGAPVVRAASGELIGVLGQVGHSEDGGLCDLGFNFAYTVANPRVRELIASGCEASGGCRPRAGSVHGQDAGRPAVGPRVDAAVSEPRDAAMLRDSGSADDAAMPRGKKSGDCGCRTPGSPAGEEPGFGAAIALYVFAVRWRSKR